MSALLVEYRFGRIVLHLLCAFRSRRLRWHLLGVCRELAPRPALGNPHSVMVPARARC
jgi:hypothetical protein